MTRGKALQPDRKLDVAASDDVLDLEVRELGIETKLLDDTGVPASSQFAILEYGSETTNLRLANFESSSLLALFDCQSSSSKQSRVSMSSDLRSQAKC